jgi:hypothetical protein
MSGEPISIKQSELEVPGSPAAPGKAAQSSPIAVAQAH